MQISDCGYPAGYYWRYQPETSPGGPTQPMAGSITHKRPHSLIRWVACDTGFIPNRLDANFKSWQERGLNIYLDFFVKSWLKTFQVQREQPDLVRQDFFRFLQLRHHIDKIFSKDELRKLGSGTGILRVFISAYRAEGDSMVVVPWYGKGFENQE